MKAVFACNEVYCWNVSVKTLCFLWCVQRMEHDVLGLRLNSPTVPFMHTTDSRASRSALWSLSSRLFHIYIIQTIIIYYTAWFRMFWTCLWVRELVDKYIGKHAIPCQTGSSSLTSHVCYAGLGIAIWDFYCITASKDMGSLSWNLYWMVFKFPLFLLVSSWMKSCNVQ